MRVDLATGTTTCLLFDTKTDDLTYLLEALQQRFLEKPAWHNPLAILATLARECGQTSDAKPKVEDDHILRTEVESKLTSWDDPSYIVGRLPEDFYRLIDDLNKSDNMLASIDAGLAFKIDVWNFVKQISTEKNVNGSTLLEQKWAQADHQFITDLASHNLGEYHQSEVANCKFTKPSEKTQQSHVCIRIQTCSPY
jgi:hypothetical protein